MTVARGWVVAVRPKPCAKCNCPHCPGWAEAYPGATFASNKIAQVMAERHRAGHPELVVRVLREGILS